MFALVLKWRLMGTGKNEKYTRTRKSSFTVDCFSVLRCRFKIRFFVVFDSPQKLVFSTNKLIVVGIVSLS
jgi:hypothetical protein